MNNINDILSNKAIKYKDLIVKNNTQYLNPRVKEVFAKFLNELINNGYTITITSSFRTLKEQKDLHKEETKNPLYSYHNFGLAIDIVLERYENNKLITLSKYNKNDWVKRGIDKIAQKYNLVWGGNFPNYVDCVHFDGRKYINKLPSELYAIVKNKSIEDKPYLV